jgi:hypothetical protein
MGISRLLSSQQNSASSNGDQEGMAQHLGDQAFMAQIPERSNVDTIHYSAH